MKGLTSYELSCLVFFKPFGNGSQYSHALSSLKASRTSSTQYLQFSIQNLQYITVPNIVHRLSSPLSPLYFGPLSHLAVPAVEPNSTSQAPSSPPVPMASTITWLTLNSSSNLSRHLPFWRHILGTNVLASVTVNELMSKGYTAESDPYC